MSCKSVPCFYINAARNIRAVVHVDDFLVSGEAPELAWLERELQKAFTIKIEELGGGPQCAREIRFLIRIIRWTEAGLEIEGDPKHVDLLERDWGLEGAKVSQPPGVRAAKELANEGIETAEWSRTCDSSSRRAGRRLRGEQMMNFYNIHE